MQVVEMLIKKGHKIDYSLQTSPYIDPHNQHTQFYTRFRDFVSKDPKTRTQTVFGTKQTLICDKQVIKVYTGSINDSQSLYNFYTQHGGKLPKSIENIFFFPDKSCSVSTTENGGSTYGYEIYKTIKNSNDIAEFELPLEKADEYITSISRLAYNIENSHPDQQTQLINTDFSLENIGFTPHPIYPEKEQAYMIDLNKNDLYTAEEIKNKVNHSFKGNYTSLESMSTFPEYVPKVLLANTLRTLLLGETFIESYSTTCSIPYEQSHQTNANHLMYKALNEKYKLADHPDLFTGDNSYSLNDELRELHMANKTSNLYTFGEYIGNFYKNAYKKSLYV